MIRFFKQHATASLLIVAAMLTWWLAASNKEKPVPQLEDPTSKLVDYYVRNFKITYMNPEGLPARTLVAEEMRHYPHDDTTELDSPFLKIYRRPGQPWDIQSESAWMSGDGNLVLLSGEVYMDRKESEYNRPVTMVTKNLRIQPNEDYAETDEQVRVTSLEDKLDAVGMQAWLRSPGRIKFLSKAKGHYVPR